VKTELKTQAENTINELDEIIVRFSDGDEEASKDYILSCRAELQKFNDLSLGDIFASGGEENSGEVDFDLFAKIFWEILNGLILGGLLGEIIAYNKKKKLLNTPEDELVPEINVDAVVTPIKTHTKKFVKFFKDRFQSGLIDAISAQVEKAQAEFANREERLKEVDDKLKKTHTEKAHFEEQTAEANRLVEDLV
jgi:uncharacterized coiled-coil protein SlyX